MASLQFTLPSKDLRRVVVTGMGTLTPLGNTLAKSWDQVTKGCSGISKISSFDASQMPVRIGGEVKNFSADKYIHPKEQKKMDKFIHFSLAATSMALKDAGIDLEGPQNHLSEKLGLRTGSIIGVGLGGMPLIEKYHSDLINQGPKKVSPFFIPSIIANLAPGQIGIYFGAKAVNYAITSACSSGGHAIGEAFRYIQRGEADIMITGGTESVISPLAVAGFSSLRALSTNNQDPQSASRPWDRDRDGFVIAEGAATLILEDYEKATQRGARIYAEIKGYGSSCDAFHMTRPLQGGAGPARAMEQAISDAQVNKDSVDYINAHGTSTPQGDLVETQAIKNVFGNQAKKIWVSSTKSMTGHTLGAAGAIESVFCAMSLYTKTVPPTINLNLPSPDCDLDYVPNQSRSKELNTILNNSFGFGGTNVCLAFSKIQ